MATAHSPLHQFTHAVRRGAACNLPVSLRRVFPGRGKAQKAMRAEVLVAFVDGECDGVIYDRQAGTFAVAAAMTTE